MIINTKAPIIQQQELTAKCNNNCAFCYNPERCIDFFAPRPEESTRNRQIAELSVVKGVMAACLTGGEPFLASNDLFAVLAIYRQAGCYTSINTNARLIDQATACKLARAGLNSALVSLHGVGELHDLMVGVKGAFKETMSGLIALKQAGVRVMPNFVATAKNIHGLGDLGEGLAKLDLTNITATPFLPSWGSTQHKQFVLTRDHYQQYFTLVRKVRQLGISIDSTLPIPPCALVKFFPDDWREYLDVHSARICMAGKSFGVVSPDGYFRACIQAPYFDNYGGNLIANYDKSWARANQWAEEKLLPDECRQCQALAICGGGCRTSCLWENNGSAAGQTMYLGEPLTQEQTKPFVDRLLVDAKPLAPLYHWSDGMKWRQEDWGVIVFNPRCQSFALLDQSAVKSLMVNPLAFESDKTTQVLAAAGMIHPIKGKPDNNIAKVSCETLSASVLLPRLAKNLAGDRVFCLRADTGERLFF